MNTTQSQLTLLNPHTSTPAVYWNGVQILDVIKINVAGGKVTLTLPEDPILAEMAGAGIVIKREAV